jgi:hypothetical protein
MQQEWGGERAPEQTREMELERERERERNKDRRSR